MNLQDMRGSPGGLCREAPRRADALLGRWQRSQHWVLLCFGFISIFFAIVTVISYVYEPSILTEAQAAQTGEKWFPHDLVSNGEDESVTRKILGGALQTLQTTLELQQDVHEERKRMESKDVEQENTDAESIHPGNSTPLDLVSELKIFVYELPSVYNSDWLNNSRCSNHLFAAEVALHQVLLKSPLRTLDPDSADFFFVPVYVACDFSGKNGLPSLNNATTIIRAAVDFISQEMTYWNRSGGSDHIFVATHDYGACFQAIEVRAKASGIPKFLQKSIILQTFGQEEEHPCQYVGSIVIPPYVSPESVEKYWAPVEQQERNILAHFRGRVELHPKSIAGLFYSKGVRTVMWQQFRKKPEYSVNRKRLEGYQVEMLHSKFCFAPLGWAPWSPRLVESVAFGCVPVIIADDIALPFSHVIDWPSISLRVKEQDVDKLDQILRDVVATNLTIIQENLWKEENRKALLYTQPLVEGDASWQIFNLLAEKKLARDV